jgi:hypothetical protein
MTQFVAFAPLVLSARPEGKLSRIGSHVFSHEVPTLLLSKEATSSPVFEPIAPNASVLVGMGLVVALCVIAATVWSSSVVPISRTKLAMSKNRGQVKEYLEDLRESDDRSFEQWLFTDWLRSNKSAKLPALPFLKKAKWNSGDNPVVVTSAIMMFGIIVASITERISH